MKESFFLNTNMLYAITLWFHKNNSRRKQGSNRDGLNFFKVKGCYFSVCNFSSVIVFESKKRANRLDEQCKRGSGNDQQSKASRWTSCAFNFLRTSCGHVDASVGIPNQISILSYSSWATRISIKHTRKLALYRARCRRACGKPQKKVYRDLSNGHRLVLRARANGADPGVGQSLRSGFRRWANAIIVSCDGDCHSTTHNASDNSAPNKKIHGMRCFWLTYCRFATLLSKSAYRRIHVRCDGVTAAFNSLFDEKVKKNWMKTEKKYPNQIKEKSRKFKNKTVSMKGSRKLTGRSQLPKNGLRCHTLQLGECELEFLVFFVVWLKGSLWAGKGIQRIRFKSRNVNAKVCLFLIFYGSRVSFYS